MKHFTYETFYTEPLIVNSQNNTVDTILLYMGLSQKVVYQIHFQGIKKQS